MSILPDATSSIEGAMSTCVRARVPMMLISLKYSPKAFSPEKSAWPKENETKRPPGRSMSIPGAQCACVTNRINNHVSAGTVGQLMNLVHRFVHAGSHGMASAHARRQVDFPLRAGDRNHLFGAGEDCQARMQETCRSLSQNDDGLIGRDAGAHLRVPYGRQRLDERCFGQRQVRGQRMDVTRRQANILAE